MKPSACLPLAVFAIGCAFGRPDPVAPAPTLAVSSVPTVTSTDEATLVAERALDGNGTALHELRTFVMANPETCTHVSAMAEVILTSDASVARREAAASVYLSCPSPDAPELFAKLAPTSAAQQAWHIARQRPSKAMATRIGSVLARTLEHGDLKPMLHDSVALAIAENRVPDTYTFLRQALAVSGRSSFAKALIQLEPRRASEAGISYLATASLEELRDLDTPKTVNTATAVVFLDHFAETPPPLDHPNFGHLFLYAVTRNQVLAQKAQAAILQLAKDRAAAVAAVLSDMAPESQVAYAQRLLADPAEESGKLARELRSRTSFAEVIATLDRPSGR